MYPVRKLAFIYGVVALGIFGFASTSVYIAFAKPAVDISPTCGPHEPGFNIVINANGFTPNGNVGVKFVGADSKITLYTHFDTNSTGGFNDVTFADDLKEGHYKLYLADDLNDDGTFDIGAARVYANVTIPCEK